MTASIWPGHIVLSVIVALALSAVLSTVILARYRKAVLRSMRTSQGLAIDEEVQADEPRSRPRSEPRPLGFQLLEQDAEAPPPELVRANRKRSVTTRAYVVAGLVHALIAALLILLSAIEEDAFLPKRVIVVWALLAWPIVPTVSYVRAAKRSLILPAALLLVALVAVAGLEILLTAAYLVGIPMLATWVLTNRRIGAVAPFAFIGVFSVVFLLFLALQAAVWIGETFGTDIFPVALLLLLLGTGAAGLLAAYLFLRYLARRYRAKATSDQLLLLDSWWFGYTLWICMVLAQEWGLAGLVGLSAFGGYWLLLRLQISGAMRASAESGKRLLLLRVFGFRRRTEDLVASVGHYWRYVGSIQLIAGTDLATTNLEPHEVLEYLGGHLKRQFVAGAEDLNGRIANRDLAPDRDGRYRVNEFFCHDNTWRATLRGLATDAQVVLMDLRSFSNSNKGCEYELTQLLRLVPLKAILLLIDESTDERLLRQTLQRTWSGMAGHEAVDADSSEPAIKLFRLPASRRVATTTVMQALCESAAS